MDCSGTYGFESEHCFSRFANWVLPGRLMAGRYPYIEPGHDGESNTHGKGIMRLQNILSTGIRTIVCLQVNSHDMQ